jgi:hypothetical protein
MEDTYKVCVIKSHLIFNYSIKYIFHQLIHRLIFNKQGLNSLLIIN